MAALLALLVAGCGERGAGGSGKTVVARVGGRAITEADLDARLGEIPQLARPEYSTPAGRARLLRQMVEEEVLYRAAVDAHLEQDPDVRGRLDASRRQILVQSFLEREQERLSKVDERELEDFYRTHKDEYRSERLVRVRLLVAANRNIAERVRAMAEAGQPFDQLCQKFSDDELAKESRGLLPGWVREGKAVPWLGNIPAFHDALKGLGAGQYSPVFESPRGFHVARVEEVRDARQRTFEEAKADIEGRLRRDRSTKGLPELIDELKARYRAEIAEAPGRSAEELFTEAQQAPDPKARIQLWEELLERYPKDAHAVEALFMIGFTKAEELHDRAGAEVAFQRVIDEFPDSELAQSARWMLTSGGDESPALGGAPAETSAAGGAQP